MANYSDVFNYFMRAPGGQDTSNPTIQGLMQSGAISTTNPAWNQAWAMSHPTEAAPYFVDPTKLPTTPYGDITQIRQIDQPSGNAVGGFTLRNPNAVTNDPNYGLITSTQNTIDPSSQRNIYDLIGPLVMSGVLGAAGAGWFGATQAGEAGALSLARGAQGLAMSGFSPGGIGSFLGGISGIPGGSTIGGALGSLAGAGMGGGSTGVAQQMSPGMQISQLISAPTGPTGLTGGGLPPNMQLALLDFLDATEAPQQPMQPLLQNSVPWNV